MVIFHSFLYVYQRVILANFKYGKKMGSWHPPNHYSKCRALLKPLRKMSSLPYVFSNFSNITLLYIPKKSVHIHNQYIPIISRLYILVGLCGTILVWCYINMVNSSSASYFTPSRPMECFHNAICWWYAPFVGYCWVEPLFLFVKTQ